ncbi:hypothetical protein RB598_009058 [Gaeumannomyces tritici]
MASTPSSNRLKLTPANSPFLARPSRSPIRARAAVDSSRLSLKRVIGTTCASPTGFDTIQSCFAYIAGGAVVVVDVQGKEYSQRFYRARPTAVPVYGVTPVLHAPSTPNSTPKANDSRNRVAASHRDSYGSNEDSPGSKTWTQRERIKAATCLSLSRDGRFLAVGETGYAPRVLIFNLQDSSSDVPLVSISEHAFGVNAVAWSSDARFLASLGSANDGFIYIWRIDPKTGAAKMFQQNRCTSFVRGMVWMGSSVITFGVRHIKAWKVEEAQSTSPSRKNFPSDSSFLASQFQKPLPGRNVVLGALLDATFTCAASIDEEKAIFCSETGDVALLDDSGKQTKLVRVIGLDFPIHCISIRDGIAHISGKSGHFATLDVAKVADGKADCVITTTESGHGLLALGFLDDHLVTIDSRQSIDVWDPKHTPGEDCTNSLHIPIPGHGDPIMGVQVLSRPNASGAAFFTWSAAGNIILWDLEGTVKATFDVAIEQTEPWNELDQPNELCIVAASQEGDLFAVADKLGVLRVIDFTTKECLMDTKAHSSDCQVVAIYEGEARVLMASCGRDRTAQLFQRTSAGAFEHFQTLEFAAKVVNVMIPSGDKVITCSLDRTLQIHDLVSKDDDSDAIAAIPSRVISLKSSPASMVMSADEKSVYVSLLDRSVCQYEIATGRLMTFFKCMDEGGVESVVLDSLIYGPSTNDGEPSILLGMSNRDKSVRMYDSASGSFLDREWGHTEAINGVTLIDDEEGQCRKVVSVGSDGTILIWTLDLSDPVVGSEARDPSPAKEISLTSTRPPLRRVLSKAELAEFQRPSTSSAAGRKSPPRSIGKRTPRYSVLAGTLKTPSSAALPTTPVPASAIAEDTPTRRVSPPAASPSESPPPSSPKDSPKTRVRRPSLPSLGATTPVPVSTGIRKKGSVNNLRASTAVSSGPYGFGSLNMATEQTSRTLRAYRKKLSSADPIRHEALTELDQELRLTAAALGDRVIRSKAMSEGLLNGLLDQYSERLVEMLDEKLRLRGIVSSPAASDGASAVVAAAAAVAAATSDKTELTPSDSSSATSTIGSESAAAEGVADANAVST